MFKTVEIDLECIVTNKIEELLSYGSYLDLDNSSLQFDRSFFGSTANISESYSEVLENYATFLTDGLLSKDWKSGVDKNIPLVSISQYENKDCLKWVPKYEPGSYWIREKKIKLHSDYSYCVKADDLVCEIDDSFDQVGVNIWKRTVDKIKVPFRVFLEEVDGGSKKYTYEIKGSEIHFKEGYKKLVGSEEFYEKTWEAKGHSISSERKIYTNYFPLEKDSLRIVATNGSNSVLFKKSKDIFSETSEDYFYEVDEDLGVITIGSKKYPELILDEDLDILSTRVRVKNSIDLKGYPSSGFILNKKGQSLYYGSKGNATLEEIVYNGDALTEGSILICKNFSKNVSSDYKYYISYNAVPRIDLEFGENLSRVCNRGLVHNERLNIKPSSNINNSGVIQISTKDTHVTKLHLRMEGIEEAGLDYYEGLYYGNSFARVVAQALDSEMEGVEEVEIHIAIESGPGFLNGGKQVTDISNSNGEIEAGYYAPYEWEDIKKDVISSTYNSNETVFQTEPLPLNLSVEDVQIYEVLKIDHNTGTRGELLYIDSKDTKYSNPNGSLENRTYLRFKKIDTLNYDDLYQYSKVSIENSSGNGWINEDIDRILEDNDYWYLFLKSNYTNTTISTLGSRCYAFRKNSLEWSANSRVGLSRVLFKWNENVKHPLTGQNGAYYPLRPSSISNDVLTYGDALKEPNPYDPDEKLGDYVILTPGMVTMYAWCQDPYTGNTIVSNRIRAKIDIPRYLNGVDFNEALPVPYGFRLRDENDDVSSGIGGLNFLSINPVVVNKLSLGLNFK